MRGSDIQSFLDKVPSDPFTVVMADGSEFEVLARSLALLHPTGRSLVVVSPKFSGAKLDEDYEGDFVDVRLITDLIKPARRLPHRKRAKA